MRERGTGIIHLLTLRVVVFTFAFRTMLNQPPVSVIINTVKDFETVLTVQGRSRQE